LVVYFWQPFVGHAVGSELDVMELIGGTEEQAAIN
jgi:hypothetical protein